MNRLIQARTLVERVQTKAHQGIPELSILGGVLGVQLHHVKRGSTVRWISWSPPPTGQSRLSRQEIEALFKRHLLPGMKGLDSALKKFYDAIWS